MSENHAQQLDTAIEAVKQRRPHNIYFVACGGSLASMYSQQYAYDVETDIATTAITSNELIHRNPKALGKDSLVILCSHSGNTAETVKAAEFARSKGALTVAYTNLVDSPLWKAAEYKLHYEWGHDCDSYERQPGIVLRFTFGCLDALYPNTKFKRVQETARDLTGIFARNKEKFAAAADAFGASYKRENIIYTMGSGPIYGEAYSFAICLLQEMQWIHAAAIHSGEYFHGPFEVTDYDVPFLLMKTVGETRPLDDRAHAFLDRYSQKVTVVDAAEFDWSGIAEDLKGYFVAPIFDTVMRGYADRLAEHRGHPLSVRRYMWKMEY